MSANLPRSLKINSHVLIFLQLNVTMFSLELIVDAISGVGKAWPRTKKAALS